MAKRGTTTINFTQLATTLMERSERGTVFLIVNEETGKAKAEKYTDSTQLEDSSYSEDNTKYIKDALRQGAYEVYVLAIDTTTNTLAKALKTIKTIKKTGYITIAEGTSEQYADLASWIKAQEKLHFTYKAVVFNVKGQDSMHIINFTTTKVKFDDGRGEKEGNGFLPTLTAILASCNVNGGVAGHICSSLNDCELKEDEDTATTAGEIFLTLDEGNVVISTAVNSLTTLNGNTKTEDMQYIETVEAMDMIADDIRDTFNSVYKNKYKNKYQNQLLFIGAVVDYFRQLENIDVLDSEYSNTAEIDVEEQRNTWVASGKSEATEWDDNKVRSMTYKRSIFLKGDIKILGCMDSLTFNISMA